MIAAARAAGEARGRRARARLAADPEPLRRRHRHERQDDRHRVARPRLRRRPGCPPVVAGNVGTPLASLGDDVDPEATIVCECSSFQLEDSVAFAPEVAVLLNFSPDHLDRHGTLDAYLDAKLRIFAAQPAGATAICRRRRAGPARRRPPRCGARGCATGSTAARAAAARSASRRERSTTTRASWSTRSELALAGEHNLRNAMAVAAAALAAGVPRDAVAAGLAQLRRRRRTGSSRSPRSTASPTSTTPRRPTSPRPRAALASFGDGVHAIFGGSLKGERLRRARAGRRRPLRRLLPDRRGGRAARRRTSPRPVSRCAAAAISAPRSTDAAAAAGAGRDGPARARLRQLRRLPRLRGARPAVPRARRGPPMSGIAASMRSGLRLRGRGVALALEGQAARVHAAADRDDVPAHLRRRDGLQRQLERLAARRRRQPLLPEADADVRRRRARRHEDPLDAAARPTSGG